MDFISAFKSELFRPLVTLLIPGAIAGGPYFVLVGRLIPPLRDFGSRHPSTATAIVIAAVTAMGLVLENWGSRLESFWDDCLARKDATHKTTWDRYLQLRLKDEIVGQRYLRTLLVRMKFELAMVPAFIAGGAGAIWLNYVSPFWTKAPWVLWIAPFVLAVYFAFESYDSAKVMSQTRKLIVDAIRADTSVLE